MAVESIEGWSVEHDIATMERRRERWEVEITADGIEIEVDDSTPYYGNCHRVVIPHAVIQRLQRTGDPER